MMNNYINISCKYLLVGVFCLFFGLTKGQVTELKDKKGNVVASVGKIETYFFIEGKKDTRGTFNYASIPLGKRKETVWILIDGINVKEDHNLRVKADFNNLDAHDPYPAQITRKKALRFSPLGNGKATVKLTFTVTDKKNKVVDSKSTRTYTWNILDYDKDPSKEVITENIVKTPEETPSTENSTEKSKEEETSQPPPKASNTSPTKPQTKPPRKQQVVVNNSSSSSKSETQDDSVEEAPDEEPADDKPQEQSTIDDNSTEGDTSLLGVGAPPSSDGDADSSKDPIDSLPMPWLIGLGVGGLLVLVLIIRAFSKKKAPDTQVVTADKGSTPKDQDKEPTAIKLNKRQPAGDGKSSTEPSILPPILSKDNAFEFELEKIWPDTAIKSVFLNKKCMKDLHEFIYEGNLLLKGTGKDVPEIGGFLLGIKEQVGEDQYNAHLQEFVSVEPESHGVYRIEFGTKAWAKLDDLKESKEYKDMEIMAWFHTHPGHGLFLSQPDLKIHEGFFLEPYQLAMEMDTLTENLEVAFFSRTKEGVINNSQQKKKNVAWFDWRTLAEKEGLKLLQDQKQAQKEQQEEAKELTDAD